jgi:hypothetical protein
MIEAIYSSGTSVLRRATRRNVPKDGIVPVILIVMQQFQKHSESRMLAFGLLRRAVVSVVTDYCSVCFQVTDTNDNPPVFSHGAYSFDVEENTGRGSRVGAVTARDVDQGVNGQVSYSVISDWANDVFSLNPQTGMFTLTARLDYEEVRILSVAMPMPVTEIALLFYIYVMFDLDR